MTPHLSPSALAWLTEQLAPLAHLDDDRVDDLVDAVLAGPFAEELGGWALTTAIVGPLADELVARALTLVLRDCLEGEPRSETLDASPLPDPALPLKPALGRSAPVPHGGHHA